MNTNAKLHERLAFSAPSEWVSMADYRQVIAVGTITTVGNVTVQLRKATSAAGANADDLGSAVTAASQAVAQAYASDLGATVAGVPYTHVCAVITGPGSPVADSGGLVIRGEGRFNG